jgi:type II secretory pathway component PulF
MPKSNFTYQAINQQGEKISGKIEAESVESANYILVARDLIPLELKEESAAQSNWLKAIKGSGSVKISDLVMFTKQFHSMLVAGIPILRILAIIEGQTENSSLKNATSNVVKDINQGSSLSDALQKFPKIFDSFTVTWSEPAKPVEICPAFWND